MAKPFGMHELLARVGSIAPSLAFVGREVNGIAGHFAGSIPQVELLTF